MKLNKLLGVWQVDIRSPYYDGGANRTILNKK